MFTRPMTVLCVVLGVVAAQRVVAAPQPLSQDDLRKLSSASDGSNRIDEAALYPLMQDAIWWTAGDESGARVPDYKAIMDEPAAHRGEFYLIEGTVAGPPQPWRGLTHPGPWDGRLQQWGIVVDTRPKPMVAVVFLVDPPDDQARPYAGDRVRAVGRFFKVWQQSDQNNEPTLYPVFVGKTFTGTTRGPGSGGGGSGGIVGGAGALLFFLLLGAMAFAWFMARRRLAQRGGNLSRRAQARKERIEKQLREGRAEDEEMEDDGPPLPKDPVEALEELERRRREKESSQEP